MPIIKIISLIITTLFLIACGGSSSDPATSSSSSSELSSSSAASSASAAPPPEGLDLIPEIPTPTPHDVIPVGNNVYFISPEGSDQGIGDIDSPFRNVEHALELAQPGDVIVLRGGVYYEEKTISIRNKSGTAEQPYTLINYPGETPIFDFSNAPGSERHGLRLDSDHWLVVGVTVRYANHNGIGVEGNHIRLERCVVHGSEDTGVHVSGLASHNLIMNCDSFENFNELRDPIGNRADGFSAKGNRLGPGNVFYGNRGYDNSDDGFDFWEAESSVVLYNNWAFNNGNAAVFGNPADFQGGGNGFKLGRTDENGNHLVYRNLAFDNRFGNAAKGFDQNSNRGRLWIINNTGYNNGRNFAFSGNTTLANNASFEGNLEVTGSTQQVTNSWQLEAELSAEDFLSIDTSLARLPRQPDGSLPDTDLLKPAPDSVLIDAGTHADLPYEGDNIDIGAYEYTP